MHKDGSANFVTRQLVKEEPGTAIAAIAAKGIASVSISPTPFSLAFSRYCSRIARRPA